MKTPPRHALFALALALHAGCASALSPGSVGTPEFASVPPQHDRVRLVLETLDDRHIDVADHRGKAVLILAFSTENVASHALARNLEAVARAHPDDLAVIAIAGDDLADRAARRTMLQTWRDVADLQHVTVAYASDDVRAGTSALGLIEHVPTLYFLNRVGAIVRRIEAFLTVEQIEALVAPARPPRSSR